MSLILLKRREREGERDRAETKITIKN
jgi:hypothetical protein